jgi:hypothetical protein
MQSSHVHVQIWPATCSRWGPSCMQSSHVCIYIHRYGRPHAAGGGHHACSQVMYVYIYTDMAGHMQPVGAIMHAVKSCTQIWPATCSRWGPSCMQSSHVCIYIHRYGRPHAAGGGHHACSQVMYTDMAGHMQPVGAIMHAVDPLGKGLST